MKNRFIAERYASALLNVAKKRGEMEVILQELSFLGKLLVKNPKFRCFLESPHITQEDKMELVRHVLSSSLTRTSINFLFLLVKKYRLIYLPEIIDEYHRLYDADMSIQRVDVISASPIDNTLSAKLQRIVEQILKKSIRLCFSIDPGIIGGLIIRTPSLIIDGSLRKKLMDLNNALLTSKV